MLSTNAPSFSYPFALSMALILSMAACGGDSRSDGDEILGSLVRAERAFAAAAAEHGVRDAFLAHLADDAVLFRPRPLPGKQYLSGSAPTPGLLAWDPELAAASLDGSLGYTTGPWLYRREPGADPVASGRYLTFWRRDAGGVWKAVIDHGIGGPVGDEGLSPGATVETRLTGTRVADEKDSDDARRRLQAMDSALAAAFAAEGGERLAAIAAPDVWVLRDGSLPLEGPGKLRSGLSDGAPSFQFAGAGVSGSGDLAYSYGEYEISAPEPAGVVRRGTYLRGWRRDEAGGWRVVVDLMTPLPVGGGR